MKLTVLFYLGEDATDLACLVMKELPFVPHVGDTFCYGVVYYLVKRVEWHSSEIYPSRQPEIQIYLEPKV